MHAISHNEHDEEAPPGMTWFEIYREGWIFDVYPRHGEQDEEYGPESIFEFLCVVDCGAFVGEEVVEDVEEGAEAGAEDWGYAEEC